MQIIDGGRANSSMFSQTAADIQSEMRRRIGEMSGVHDEIAKPASGQDATPHFEYMRLQLAWIGEQLTAQTSLCAV